MQNPEAFAVYKTWFEEMKTLPRTKAICAAIGAAKMPLPLLGDPELVESLALWNYAPEDFGDISIVRNGPNAARFMPVAKSMQVYAHQLKNAGCGDAEIAAIMAHMSLVDISAVALPLRVPKSKRTDTGAMGDVFGTDATAGRLLTLGRSEWPDRLTFLGQTCQPAGTKRSGTSSVWGER